MQACKVTLVNRGAGAPCLCTVGMGCLDLQAYLHTMGLGWGPVASFEAATALQAAEARGSSRIADTSFRLKLAA